METLASNIPFSNNTQFSLAIKGKSLKTKSKSVILISNEEELIIALSQMLYFILKPKGYMINAKSWKAIALENNEYQLLVEYALSKNDVKPKVFKCNLIPVTNPKVFFKECGPFYYSLL